MRTCLQEGDSQVNCSSVPLKSVSEVCDVFGNQVYPSTSRGQPRAIAKACIVLGVSYANFEQSLSSLLSLCTVGFWSCSCFFSLSPRNWHGVLKKVKKVCFCWVAFTIDSLTRTPQDYPDYVLTSALSSTSEVNNFLYLENYRRLTIPVTWLREWKVFCPCTTDQKTRFPAL